MGVGFTTTFFVAKDAPHAVVMVYCMVTVVGVAGLPNVTAPVVEFIGATVGSVLVHTPPVEPLLV